MAALYELAARCSLSWQTRNAVRHRKVYQQPPVPAPRTVSRKWRRAEPLKNAIVGPAPVGVPQVVRETVAVERWRAEGVLAAGQRGRLGTRIPVKPLVVHLHARGAAVVAPVPGSRTKHARTQHARGVTVCAWAATRQEHGQAVAAGGLRVVVFVHTHRPPHARELQRLQPPQHGTLRTHGDTAACERKAPQKQATQWTGEEWVGGTARARASIARLPPARLAHQHGCLCPASSGRRFVFAKKKMRRQIRDRVFNPHGPAHGPLGGRGGAGARRGRRGRARARCPRRVRGTRRPAAAGGLRGAPGPR